MVGRFPFQNPANGATPSRSRQRDHGHYAATAATLGDRYGGCFLYAGGERGEGLHRVGKLQGPDRDLDASLRTGLRDGTLLACPVGQRRGHERLVGSVDLHDATRDRDGH